VMRPFALVILAGDFAFAAVIALTPIYAYLDGSYRVGRIDWADFLTRLRPPAPAFRVHAANSAFTTPSHPFVEVAHTLTRWPSPWKEWLSLLVCLGRYRRSSWAPPRIQAAQLYCCR
jgi:hypothetical protein